mmetsp:Transcript_8548/g.25728  ORF Transcript_8548/g.25728 Transcript_8548/m.25728 type:complete len:453 (+) Transcript_8548:2964-4322(+)
MRDQGGCREARLAGRGFRWPPKIKKLILVFYFSIHSTKFYKVQSFFCCGLLRSVFSLLAPKSGRQGLREQARRHARLHPRQQHVRVIEEVGQDLSRRLRLSHPLRHPPAPGQGLLLVRLRPELPYPLGGLFNHVAQDGVVHGPRLDELSGVLAVHALRGPLPLAGTPPRQPHQPVPHLRPKVEGVPVVSRIDPLLHYVCHGCPDCLLHPPLQLPLLLLGESVGLLELHHPGLNGPLHPLDALQARQGPQFHRQEPPVVPQGLHHGAQVRVGNHVFCAQVGAALAQDAGREVASHLDEVSLERRRVSLLPAHKGCGVGRELLTEGSKVPPAGLYQVGKASHQRGGALPQQVLHRVALPRHHDLGVEDDHKRRKERPGVPPPSRLSPWQLVKQTAGRADDRRILHHLGGPVKGPEEQVVAVDLDAFHDLKARIDEGRVPATSGRLPRPADEPPR